MKLSEAILLGSVGSKQGFGPYSIYSNSEKRCALGAALHAVGRRVPFTECGLTPYRIIQELWPWTKVRIKRPLEASTKIFSECEVYQLIWDLNDTDKWTRPRIAEWVAELEKVYDRQEDGLEKCEGTHSDTLPFRPPVNQDAPAPIGGQHAHS